MPHPDNSGWMSLLLGVEVPASRFSSPDQIPAARAGVDLTVNNVDMPDMAAISEKVSLGESNNRELTAEVYRPHGQGPFPAMVYFHGGGFCLANAAGARRPAMRLGAGVGMLVVNVDYALAPERPFPQAVQDAVHACRWVAANADELGVDPSRIVVSGDSAGANLAAVCAHVLNGSPQSVVTSAFDGLSAPRISALVLFFGLFDFQLALMEPGSNSGAVEVWWNQAYLGPFWLDHHHDPLVSPIRSPHLDQFPPTYLVCGDQDSLIGNTLAMARALCAANVPTTVSVIAGVDHAFHYVEPKLSQIVTPEMDRIIAWLCDELGTPGHNSNAKEQT